MSTPIDNDLSTLAQIQTKVRRLTRSISEQQLSTTELNNYINTSVLYDFPEHLRQRLDPQQCSSYLKARTS